MEALLESITDNFGGDVTWYGETVKLNLQARHVAERTKIKPEITC